MKKNDIIIPPLIPGYMEGTLRRAEKKLLGSWVAASGKNRKAFEKLCEEYLYSEALIYYDDGYYTEGRKKLSQAVGFEIPHSNKRPR